MSINHIGLTVGNLAEAIEFYTSVFGLRRLTEVEEANRHTLGAERRAQVFGPRWGEMRLAHLVDDNGTGLELFEFVEPAMALPAEHFDYWRVGFSHLAFTVADLERALGALVEAGGEVRTDIHSVRPGCRICYGKDPWGNPIELSTGTYAQTHPGVAG